MKRRRRPARRMPPIAWKPLAIGLGALISSLGIIAGTWWAAPRAWRAIHDHPYFAIREVECRHRT